MIREFVRLESSSGLLLVVAAVLAMFMKNIPFTEYYYAALLNTPVHVTVGDFDTAIRPSLIQSSKGLAISKSPTV